MDESIGDTLDIAWSSRRILLSIGRINPGLEGLSEQLLPLFVIFGPCSFAQVQDCCFIFG
jgi:hypothetical protein